MYKYIVQNNGGQYLSELELTVVVMQNVFIEQRQTDTDRKRERERERARLHSANSLCTRKTHKAFAREKKKRVIKIAYKTKAKRKSTETKDR